MLFVCSLRDVSNLKGIMFFGDKQALTAFTVAHQRAIGVICWFEVSAAPPTSRESRHPGVSTLLGMSPEPISLILAITGESVPFFLFKKRFVIDSFYFDYKRKELVVGVIDL